MFDQVTSPHSVLSPQPPFTNRLAAHHVTAVAQLSSAVGYQKLEQELYAV
jgi:hypothetical protein